MKYFFSVLIFVGLALQARVIQALIRGPLRRFVVLFGYAVILFLTTVVDATAYFNGPQFRAVFREYYWIDEVLRKTSLFILVLSLIANALAKTERRARILALLVLASIIVAGLSAWLLYDPTARSSRWMTEIVRNLAFFASILNLILWFAMTTLNVQMRVQLETQQVTVQETVQNAVSTDPSNNVGALVLKGEDLEALSDDPDDLQDDLTALAGPSAGPNGAQMFIDGFTGGRLPPKESIREIRINQNPFSAEYDKLGYGRIEIFTKPGTDKFHGQAFMPP